MPKETFYNLSTDKQARVYQAAIKEYCRVPFEQVSIKNVVVDAAIARGSFYQYFDDKADLLAYLIGQIHEEVVLQQPTNQQGFNYFSWLVEQEIEQLASLQAEQSIPAQLLKQIAKSPIALKVFETQLVKRLQAASFLKSDWMLASPPKELRQAALELMFYAGRTALLEVLSGENSTQEIIKKLRAKLLLLKRGLQHT